MVESCLRKWLRDDDARRRMEDNDDEALCRGREHNVANY